MQKTTDLDSSVETHSGTSFDSDSDSSPTFSRKRCRGHLRFQDCSCESRPIPSSRCEKEEEDPPTF
ncbi:19242_t:CDS:2 [Gigaspora rosea]|nr:19242_t:CDS:2 [Gigaspora rosea]